jgi:5'(3')-deoxyribonucleotidase
MRVYLDMDETLVNLVSPWLDCLNKMSGLDVTRDMLGTYSVEEPYKDKLSVDEIFLPFNTEGFWEDLPPFPGAVDFVRSLVENDFDVYIATIPALGPVCHYEKESWIMNHLPFIGRERLIFCHHKQLLRGEALLDDNPKYLAKFKGKRLLFDKPWNQDDQLGREGYIPAWYIRMHSYDEVFNFLMQLEFPF